MDDFKQLDKPSNKYIISSSDDEDDILATIPKEVSSSDIEEPVLKKTKTVKKTGADKVLQKIRREEAKRLKQEQLEKDKEMKKLLKDVTRKLKPEDYFKQITAEVDKNFPKASSSEICIALKNLQFSVELVDQLVPNSVTWKRKVQVQFINDDNKPEVHDSITEENELLIIMQLDELVDLVKQSRLTSRIVEIQTLVGNKRIFLGILCNSKRNKMNKNSSLEMALTELQILHGCCYRVLNTTEDLCNLIVQFSKSIAQIPYKIEKNKKIENEQWFVTGDNKDCVRVDKQGNGLQRLYQQSLTTFSLARIETAEAIASKYPTITHLMNAYEKCDTKAEKQTLLQDIAIRRAAGPIANVRKIGPELSKKVCKFFTEDGATIL